LIALAAGGLLLAWEAILLNTLSVFRLVVPWTVLAGHLLLIATVALYDRGSQAAKLLSLARHGLAGMRLGWMLVPLFVLLLVCAVAFSPSTPDSMAYHLARVAYWMQNRSVAYYATANAHQNVMGPGAEYLVLVLQIISGSDFWANCVQLAAYLIVVLSIPTLCRLTGVPRRLCPWASVFVAALPIAVLEASTTQNDLVACVVTLALVGVSLRFLHRTPRWRGNDLLALGLLTGVGYLTKPTALLAASPFLLGAAILAFTPSTRRHLRTRWKYVAAAAALVVALAGPDVYRKHEMTGSVLGARYEVYPVLGNWKDRALNAARATCQNLPARGAIRTIERLLDEQPAPLYCDQVFAPNEDRAGNPFQFVILMISLTGALLFWWRLGWRERLFALSVPAAWLMLHAFVRNQEFITRLQLPVLVLIPLAWGGFIARRLPGSSARGSLLAISSLACLCYGVVIACTNQMKPLSLPGLLTMDRTEHYYLLKHEAYAQHSGVLAMLKQMRCSRLGLVTDTSSYDYPITWRAMREGVTVRHVMGPSDWPCLILSDHGAPPDPAGRWFSTPIPGVYASGTDAPGHR